VAKKTVEQVKSDFNSWVTGAAGGRATNYLAKIREALNTYESNPNKDEATQNLIKKINPIQKNLLTISTALAQTDDPSKGNYGNLYAVLMEITQATGEVPANLRSEALSKLNSLNDLIDPRRAADDDADDESATTPEPTASPAAASEPAPEPAPAAATAAGGTKGRYIPSATPQAAAANIADNKCPRCGSETPPKVLAYSTDEKDLPVKIQCPVCELKNEPSDGDPVLFPVLCVKERANKTFKFSKDGAKTKIQCDSCKNLQNLDTIRDESKIRVDWLKKQQTILKRIALDIASGQAQQPQQRQTERTGQRRVVETPTPPPQQAATPKGPGRPKKEPAAGAGAAPTAPTAAPTGDTSELLPDSPARKAAAEDSEDRANNPSTPKFTRRHGAAPKDINADTVVLIGIVTFKDENLEKLQPPKSPKLIVPPLIVVTMPDPGPKPAWQGYHWSWRQDGKRRRYMAPSAPGAQDGFIIKKLREMMIAEANRVYYDDWVIEIGVHGRILRVGPNTGAMETTEVSSGTKGRKVAKMLKRYKRKKHLYKRKQDILVKFDALKPLDESYTGPNKGQAQYSIGLMSLKEIFREPDEALLGKAISALRLQGYFSSPADPGHETFDLKKFKTEIPEDKKLKF
jgi:hypothetical protein